MFKQDKEIFFSALLVVTASAWVQFARISCVLFEREQELHES